MKGYQVSNHNIQSFFDEIQKELIFDDYRSTGDPEWKRNAGLYLNQSVPWEY